MRNAIIGGLQKQTILDYPGKIACTIFISGCNFRCKYCHNPGLNKNTKSIYTKEKILEFLNERKEFLDAVCISGGEPTLNEDLPDFISKIKKMGFLVKLDTNGTNPKMLKELIENNLVDYVAMDVKAPLDFYENVTDSKIEKENIKESINLIKKMENYEFRITVVPGLFKEEYAKMLGEWLSGAKKFYIQQFRNIETQDKKLNKIKPFSKEELEKFCSILKPYFEKCEIRGI
jgi:pyruvate formate lyase activating enzyme